MDVPVEMTVLFQAAHAAANSLRRWVVGQFELHESHIDRAQASSIAQFDQVARLGKFCGYDVSGAPEAYLLSIRTYMKALRNGRPPRPQKPLSAELIAAHREIVRASEVPGKRYGKPRK